MKRLSIIVVTIALLSSISAFAQGGPRDLAGRGDTAERPQAQLQKSIADLYLANFKDEVGLSDEQFLKVRPLVLRFIQMRFQAANQKRILEERQDQLLSQPNPSEAEIQKLNEELTKLDEAATLDGRFMRNLQPELSERQRLLAFAFHRKFINEKLPMMLERLRAANAAPQKQQRPAAAGRANQNRKETAQPTRPANTLRGKNNETVPVRKN